MVIVLADDLTGAASSAALLRQRGLQTSLVNFPKFPNEAVTSGALVVNTRTRDLTPAEARRRLEGCLEAVLSWPLEPVLWCKRVDSTLRGPVGAELQVLLKNIAPRTGVLAPSYPEANRVTKQGIQFLEGERIGDLRDLVSGLPGLDRIQIGGRFSNTKGLWWIPDISVPDDVSSVAATLSPHKHELLVVDSGPLIAELADTGTHLRGVLVVMGSGADTAKCQLRHLSWANRSGAEIIYEPLQGRGDGNLDVLANTAKQRLRQRRFVGIVVGGGLTSEAVVEALECEALEPLGSPGPLLALSRLLGGEFHGLLVATKGGAVGNIDALVYLVDLIQMWNVQRQNLTT